MRVDQNLRIVPNHAPWPLSLHTTGALATIFSFEFAKVTYLFWRKKWRNVGFCFPAKDKLERAKGWQNYIFFVATNCQWDEKDR